MAQETNNRATPGADPAQGRRRDPGGKLFPPDSPVDVPNTPPPAPPESGAAGAESNPEAETRADDSWADNTKPAPYKKTVRGNPYAG